MSNITVLRYNNFGIFQKNSHLIKLFTIRDHRRRQREQEGAVAPPGFSNMVQI